METSNEQRLFTDTARALNAFYQEINDLPVVTVGMLMRIWHSHLAWYWSHITTDVLQQSAPEGQRVARRYTALAQADIPPEIAGQLMLDWYTIACPEPHTTQNASQSR